RGHGDLHAPRARARRHRRRGPRRLQALAGGAAQPGRVRQAPQQRLGRRRGGAALPRLHAGADLAARRGRTTAARVGPAVRILGPDGLIGVSTHDLDQLRRAILDGAGYVGVGPTFSSATKNFPHLAGLDYVRQAVAESSLPAFAIGGITLDNLPAVLAAGAR